MTFDPIQNGGLDPRPIMRPAVLAAALATALATGAAGYGLGTMRTQTPPPQEREVTQVKTMAVPSFADLAAKVKPAVVSVTAEAGPSRAERRAQSEILNQLPPGLRDFFSESQVPGQQRISAGSGFIISADGYVVTNGHVVGEAGEVQVATEGGKSFSAKVVGVDQRSDIALLHIDARGLPYVRFSHATPRIGDWVMAVGDPFGLGGTVTAGIISGRGRDLGSGPYDDFLQIDAPINQGNSGGPSFNLSGDVIGMNTAIVSPSGGSVGLGFAIPAAQIERIVADLKSGGTVERGWLGVTAEAVTPTIAQAVGLTTPDGALIDETAPNGPVGDKLRRGDILVRIDGAPVADPRDLARAIAAHRPGDSVTLDIMRQGRTVQESVQLGKLPNSPA